MNTCLPTANPSPAFLAVAISDQQTVVISIAHVWNLFRTEDVHLHTPALRIGTHFLLTLTVVFHLHLLSTTSKSLSFLSTKLAHAARLGFFYKKNALYKFTVNYVKFPDSDNSLTFSRWFAALLRGTRHVKCYSYHAPTIVLSMVGVGKQQFMIRNHIIFLC